jgi:transcription antitermination factor NusB
MPSLIQQKINTRLLLTQIVYQHHVRQQPLPVVAKEYVFHHLNANPNHYHRDFFDTMVAFLSQARPSLEQKLRSYETEQWRYERMDPVLLGILMVGMAELLVQPETPTNVIINEYIELTKDFLNDKDAKFVHVLLDKTAVERTGAANPKSSDDSLA